MSALPVPVVSTGHSSTYQSIDALSGEGGTKRAKVEAIAAEAVGEQKHAADLYGVTVKVISASDLMSADLFTRSSDPYCKVWIDGVERKTRVIKKCLDPEWNQTFTWVFEKKPKTLTFEVFDWDKVRQHIASMITLVQIRSIGL